MKALRETTLTKDGYTYRYRLTRLRGVLSLYSIRISLCGKGVKSTREASVALSDTERAMDLYNKLVRNLATPENLAYCIEDEGL